MLVRIQLKSGPVPRNRTGLSRRVALALASLLGPASLMLAILGLWRLAVDFDLAEDFDLHYTLLSRGESLLGAAIALQAAAILLDRFGGSVR